MQRIALGILLLMTSLAQAQEVPAVYNNITTNEAGELGYRNNKGALWPLANGEPRYTLNQMRAEIKGTDEGLRFDF